MDEGTITMDGTLHLQALRVEAAEEIIGVGVGNEDAGDSVQTFRTDMRMNCNHHASKLAIKPGIISRTL